MLDTIEGRYPVIEALKAGHPINKILLARDIKVQGTITKILQLSRARGVPVEYIERHLLSKLSLTGASQGVIAYTAARKFADLADLITISKEKKGLPLFVILDGIEDPHNLGAILRTAEATGVNGVIVRSRRAVGITPTVVKASAGATEYVPVATVTNISQAIETLKKNGVWIIGIDMSGESDYTRIDFRLPAAIVIGGEGKGLSTLVRQKCDFVAFIPMTGRIASLNASVAAAVVMYESLRQRGPYPHSPYSNGGRSRGD